MTRLIAILCATAFVALVSGCNTIEGAGQDVKAGGHAIEKAADKAKPN
ncbi:MAG: entericidin A/B family lipoprotein [Betaproteobacteria bacterium]